MMRCAVGSLRSPERRAGGAGEDGGASAAPPRQMSRTTTFATVLLGKQRATACSRRFRSGPRGRGDVGRHDDCSASPGASPNTDPEPMQTKGTRRSRACEASRPAHTLRRPWSKTWKVPAGRTDARYAASAGTSSTGTASRSQPTTSPPSSLTREATFGATVPRTLVTSRCPPNGGGP